MEQQIDAITSLYKFMLCIRTKNIALTKKSIDNILKHDKLVTKSLCNKLKVLSNNLSPTFNDDGLITEVIQKVMLQQMKLMKTLNTKLAKSA